MTHLERIPENPKHSNAIAVMTAQNERAGWIIRDLADSLSPPLRDGNKKTN
jgi:hypothetical protein